jgi:PIN domain nuclease of toxin-antitoxin system
VSRTFVTDTHPLVWFSTNKHKQLSSRVRDLFEACSSGASAIHVPVVVLWETSLLLKKGKIRINMSFDDWRENLFSLPGFHCLALEESDVGIAHDLTFTHDPFDAMIVATALRMGAPLITNDSLIHEAVPCELFW